MRAQLLLTSPKEYQATQWQSVNVLIDCAEMKDLLDHLHSPLIYPVGSLQQKGVDALETQDFLDGYNQYIQALKEGRLPLDTLFRPLFATCWSLSSDHLYKMKVNDTHELIRIKKPVIQLQPHYFDYSFHDEKVHSQVLGQEAILWGIQFSYPGLYQDPDTHVVLKVKERDEFPNTKMFKELQRWVRNATSPTRFYIQDKVINTSIRLGIKCKEWINCHPQLIKKGYRV